MNNNVTNQFNYSSENNEIIDVQNNIIIGKKRESSTIVHANRSNFNINLNCSVVYCNNHNYITKVELEPTCTENGKSSQHCEICDHINKSYTIQKLGHDFTDWESMDTSVNVCIEKGTAIRYCNRCDYSETKATNPLGHDYIIENYECTNCHETFKNIPNNHACNADIISNKICTRCGDHITAIASEMVVHNSTGTFDVRAKDKNGNEVQSTYGNNGYNTTLKVGSSTIGFNSETVTFNGIQGTRTFNYNGGRLVTSYILVNTTENVLTVGIGVDTDIMVAGNDSAPVYKNDKGIYMTSGGYTYQIFLMNTPGVINCTTRWVGNYSSRNAWSNSSASSYSGDSGIGFSWQNIQVTPGSPVTITYMIELTQ